MVAGPEVARMYEEFEKIHNQTSLLKSITKRLHVFVIDFRPMFLRLMYFKNTKFLSDTENSIPLKVVGLSSLKNLQGVLCYCM